MRNLQHLHLKNTMVTNTIPLTSQQYHSALVFEPRIPAARQAGEDRAPAPPLPLLDLWRELVNGAFFENLKIWRLPPTEIAKITLSKK
jgi:hypothetical protein